MPVRKIKFFLIFNLLFAVSSFAQTSLHWSGKKTRWDRKNNIVELFEKAQVSRSNEIITANYIKFNTETYDLDAVGQCVYVMPDMVVRAEELHFNLNTRLGQMIRGKITNGQFSLQGNLITRTGGDSFIAETAEYTTCQDCASAWSLLSNEIRVQINGYASMSTVYFKIKDNPIFWFPYLILPIKNKRESGVLMPKTRLATPNGSEIILPLYWAINSFSDMTLGIGTYTSRGLRLEWEGRYTLTDKSGAQINFFYNDWKFADIDADKPVMRGLLSSRWAASMNQTQVLPWGITQKLQLREVSDNYVPDFYLPDIPRNANPYLSSELSLSKSSSDFSGFIEFKRTRNMILESSKDLRTFDDRTVQLAPRIVLSTNDQSIVGTPLVTGFLVGFNQYTRPIGFFDKDPEVIGSDPNTFVSTATQVDPIRKAIRVNFQPSIYTTLRPINGVSLIPSAQYRYNVYHFGNSVDSLGRGYPLLRAELSFQLERTFDTKNPLSPRVKHLMRPLLTYNYIPSVQQPDTHPFVRQIERSPSYVFDNNDLIPFNVTRNFQSFQIPLGNSLTYGFVTQVIRRNGHLDLTTATYEKLFEFSATQNINFLQLSQSVSNRIPLSRLQSNLFFGSGPWGWGTDYQWIPDIEKYGRPWSDSFMVNSSFSYTLVGTRSGMSVFNRSISIGASYNPGFYNPGGPPTVALTTGLRYSISDYIMPSIVLAYDLTNRVWISQNFNLTLQDASQCWQLSSGFVRNNQGAFGFSFDIKINLTGSGFGNITDAASYVAPPNS
ncbi:MAG: hypothetical protein KA715_07775 [Xanthomonadaceae bacterium]|nr:hypothetical protein [Xanthomonadaceae bacterium]